MITGKNIYDVLAAVVPLYFAMILAYGSVRWWKIFTPDQCSGINHFVTVFAIPFFCFSLISSIDPLATNYKFIAADSLQKLVILVALFLWQAFSKRGNLDWTITIFSLSTLPNTILIGIPLFKALYGDFTTSLVVQIEFLQSLIWFPLLLFLYEYRAAKLLISEQFSETTASIITSCKVNHDVVSLNGNKKLQADTDIGDAAMSQNMRPVGKTNGVMEHDVEDGRKRPPNGSSAIVMTRLIVIMVWRKLMRNPNIYSSLFGIIWSLISSRWHIQMPLIISGSVSIISDGALGIVMFAIGFFMASQPKAVACGKSAATFAMALRFLVGPAVIAAISIAIGIRGVLLNVAIVQAALSQGIVPFVFAKEYDVHPDIFSTAVVFGMLIAMPIVILYYVLLGISLPRINFNF